MKNNSILVPSAKLLSLDFGELERRLVIEPTKDIHNEKAEELFGPDFTPKQRQLAKTINFSELYSTKGPFK